MAPYYSGNPMGVGMMQGNPFSQTQSQYGYDDPYRYYSTTRLNTRAPISVPKVHGEEGARTYPFGTPNSSILLLDDTDPIVWLRMNNELGHPTIYGYSISPLSMQTPEASQEEESDSAQPDLKELFHEYDERLTKLEGRMSNNAKSNSSSNGGRNGHAKQSGNANGESE